VKRFYDSVNDRLVYVDNKANECFWDVHWNKYDIEQAIKLATLNRLILVPTHKYLFKGAQILEGGCGLGQNVWSLQKNGYDAYGIDYAEDTVKKVNAVIPELKVSCCDVRRLKFENDFFDGYWSLGVVEHFYEGFDTIAHEMNRVIKPGGYLFLTFPCMSKFRRRKVRLGKYKIWKENPSELDNFYQFALPEESVISHFLNDGFTLIEKKSIGGLKGFKDEIEHKEAQRLLQKLYDSGNIVSRVLAWGLDQLLAPFAGHCKLLVFRKTN